MNLPGCDEAWGVIACLGHTFLLYHTSTFSPLRKSDWSYYMTVGLCKESYLKLNFILKLAIA